jgi:hypothetical protein
LAVAFGCVGGCLVEREALGALALVERLQLARSKLDLVVREEGNGLLFLASGEELGGFALGGCNVRVSVGARGRSRRGCGRVRGGMVAILGEELVGEARAPMCRWLPLPALW